MKRNNRNVLVERKYNGSLYVEKFLRRGSWKGRDENRKDETKEKRFHIKENKFFFFSKNTNLSLHKKYGAMGSGCLKMQ